MEIQPNNIGNIDNIIANERRLYNNRVEQLQTFIDKYNDENENKETLYNDVQGAYNAMSPVYYELKNILKNVEEEMKANEETRNNLRKSKQEVEGQIEQRARNISVQVLNDYVAGLESQLAEFKQHILNIKSCKEKADGFKLIDECKKAKDICDDMLRNYLRKMTTLLMLVKSDVNTDNYKKQGRLKNVEVD